MIDLGREINSAACNLATEIVDCAGLTGQRRDDVGLVLERALKRFAQTVLQEAEKRPAVFG